MDLKKQVDTIKNNWLILLLVLVLMLVLNGNFLNTNLSSNILGLSKSQGVSYDMAYNEASYSRDGGNFAPEVEERIKTLTSTLSTEIKRGEFASSEEKLNQIIQESNSYILNENIRKSDSGFNEISYASYTIKVDILEYEQTISKLKEIGEVQSYNENTNDITGEYTDLNTELELEKERLSRYQEMYNEAKEIEDKITLNDRIFNQERTIKYLEDRINNLDKRVDYSTIYFNMNEERSEYTNIALVKLSELIKAFVGSINNLFQLFFVVIPWIVFCGIVYFIYKKFKK